MNRLYLLSTVFVAALFLTSLSSAVINAPEGSSIRIDDANSTIQMAQDYSFNGSKMLFYNKTVQLGDNNISIYSNSSEELNSTLHKYNLSNVSSGKTMVKVETNETSNTQVNYSFTDLPSINYGNYRVEVDGHLKKKQGNGGAISWSHSDWSSHNFTVTYENDTSNPSISLSLSSSTITEGDSVTISCSSSDPSGIQSSSLQVTKPDGSTVSKSCGVSFSETSQTGEYTVKYSATDNTGNSAAKTETLTVESSDDDDSSGGSDEPSNPSTIHSWVGVNKTNFNLEPDTETTVENITVETTENQSSFEISVEKLGEKPEEVEELENSYNYLEIEVSASDEEIQDTNIEFTVDQSFASNYDNITLSRYNNGWNDLPTRPVETSGDTWTYEANNNGFSYYSVRGVNNQQEDDNQTQDNRTNNEEQPSTTEPDTDQTQNGTNQTDQTDDKETREGLTQSERLLAILGIIGFILLTIYLMYVKKKQN